MRSNTRSRLARRLFIGGTAVLVGGVGAWVYAIYHDWNYDTPMYGALLTFLACGATGAALMVSGVVLAMRR